MRRVALELPWAGIAAAAGVFGVAGAESRLAPALRRVHSSRCARALAIDLLSEQGAGDVAQIRKDARGRPRWPTGFTGSLSHTESRALAATAALDRCVSLGVDVEPARPLPPDADTRLLAEDERRWLGAGDAARGPLLFSARQCVHKAIEPLRGAWLEFDDVAIEIDEAARRFTPRPRTPRARAAFDGLHAQGLVHRVEDHWMLVLVLFDAPGHGRAERLG